MYELAATVVACPQSCRSGSTQPAGRFGERGLLACVFWLSNSAFKFWYPTDGKCTKTLVFVQEIWYSCTFLSCCIGIIWNYHRPFFWESLWTGRFFPGWDSADEDLLNHMAGANQQLEEPSIVDHVNLSCETLWNFHEGALEVSFWLPSFSVQIDVLPGSGKKAWWAQGCAGNAGHLGDVLSYGTLGSRGIGTTTEAGVHKPDSMVSPRRIGSKMVRSAQKPRSWSGRPSMKSPRIRITSMSHIENCWELVRMGFCSCTG